MMNTLLRTIVLAAVVSFSLAAFAQGPPASPDAARASIGYSAEYTATYQTDSREPQVVYKELRFVSSTGNWRSVQKHSGGKTVEKFAEIHNGLFLVDENEKKLIRLAPYTGVQKLGSEHENQGRSRFINSEQMLGFEVDVFRVETDQGTLVLYRAPKLNNHIVKVIRQGTNSTFTLFAISITLGEPSPESLSHPDYPVVEDSGANFRTRK